MSSDRIHLGVDEARALGERALRGIGYDAAEAWIIADHVIDAALCGYEYSGLAKILNIPEHRRFKRPRHAMKVLRGTEISTLYHGGNNVGMLLMKHAARAASESGSCCPKGWRSMPKVGRPAIRRRRGSGLPFGGYKGFGLAFIVQGLGVLAGSALNPDRDDGYLFVVLKPDLLIDPGDFKEQ